MANVGKVSLTFSRGYRQYTKTWLKDAVRYEQVKYHPSKKDHVDPPITPSKILMVHRVKPYKGNPYWEKDILREVGLHARKAYPAFVKNTPENCALLWKIKHLVRIVPVELPEQLRNVDEFSSFFIHDCGKIVNTGKMDPDRYQSTVDFQNSVKRMRYSTITEKLRLLWCRGNLI